MTEHVAVAHIGKEACDGGVGLAGVVGDLPVIPLLPGFAQGFLDLWNVLLRQSGGPAVHATGKVSMSHNTHNNNQNINNMSAFWLMMSYVCAGQVLSVQSRRLQQDS